MVDGKRFHSINADFTEKMLLHRMAQEQPVNHNRVVILTAFCFSQEMISIFLLAVCFLSGFVSWYLIVLRFQLFRKSTCTGTKTQPAMENGSEFTISWVKSARAPCRRRKRRKNKYSTSFFTFTICLVWKVAISIECKR